MRFLQPAIDQYKPSGSSQYAVGFNALTTAINCGSDAALDDLHAGEFTLDGWAWADSTGENDIGIFALKTGNNVGADGWSFRVGNPGAYAIVATDNQEGYSIPGLDEFPSLDGTWYHYTMYYNNAGDRKIYIAHNGVWTATYSTQIAAVGAIQTDAANNFLIGNRPDGAATFDGGFAWTRLSNNDRYNHGVGFTPPAKDAPPAVDVNTVEQWNMNEGSGATAAAEVSTPTNDGAITDGSWVSL